MIQLPKFSWKEDYCEDLSFLMLREKFFPEFPQSIFYTRKGESDSSTNWISTKGNFALRQKIFAIKGKVNFRGEIDGIKWLLDLEVGEYGEIPKGDYQFRYVSAPSLFYRVIERPPNFINREREFIHIK